MIKSIKKLMQKMKKRKGFTLVELIVVITILVILAAITFISLQGFSMEARDSKRITDTRNLLGKINIENTAGTPLQDLIDVKISTGIIINHSNAITNIGISNFVNLKENPSNFKDPLNSKIDYPVAYSKGGTGTGSYIFTQIATISEKDYVARLYGNYYMMQNGDAPSLFNSGGIFVEDGKSIFPYFPWDDLDESKNPEPPVSQNCTINFDTNGLASISPIEIECGKPIGTLPIPSNTQCDIFQGWQDSEGTEITDNYIISNNTTINANWSKLQYELRFESMGGTAQAPKKVECGEPVGELPIPERISYTFNGWHENSSGGTEFTKDSILIDGDKTVYASWSMDRIP